MMKNIIVNILMVFTCCAVSGQGIIEIKVPNLLKPERIPVLSEIANDIQFVKLQTSPDCLIGSVGSINKWGNNFLIVANSGKSPFVFSKEGNFLKSFGNVGKGPGEFLEIYGMAFDPLTNHLFILDNGQVKLLEFDDTGKFIKEFKLGFYATGVKVTEGGFVFYTNSVYTCRTDGCLLTVTDRSGKVLNRYHKKSLVKGTPANLVARYNDRGDWCYWEANWDTVYAFNGTSYRSKYFFNIGKNKIPEEYLDSGGLSSKNVDSYTWVNYFKEFENFLYIDIIDRNREGKKLIFNKDSQTGYCILWETKYHDWGFENDFTGGPLFSLDNKISMSEVVCTYQITDLKEYLSEGWIDKKNARSQTLYKELTDMIKRSAIDDNPILVIAKLK